ncbi:antimicrobial peptide microplusin-like [Ixodes scapularis]|uniref:antimicrobial peptide microplusin-like n=1 Tax=Ixodes scapularis TaxID=6945 RepID=UPI001A9DBD83|nr:antimicrobial peptide microplusin-like [Ixodes scapularis]
MKSFLQCSAFVAYVLLVSSQDLNLCPKTDAQLNVLFNCVRGKATDDLKFGLHQLQELTHCSNDVCSVRVLCMYPRFEEQLKDYLTQREYQELIELVRQCQQHSMPAAEEMKETGLVHWTLSFFH